MFQHIQRERVFAHPWPQEGEGGATGELTYLSTLNGEIAYGFEPENPNFAPGELVEGQHDFYRIPPFEVEAAMQPEIFGDRPP